MPVDYAEVLKDLDAQIASLEAEIATLKSGRPTIVLLRNRYAPVQRVEVSDVRRGPYVGMGATAAIPFLLKEHTIALTASEIADRLSAGGVVSKGQDFTGNVSATLSRLRDQGIVEKVGEGWKLKVITESERWRKAANMNEVSSPSSSEPEPPSVQ